MSTSILPSARRHGISDEAILHAYRNAFMAYPQPGGLTILVGDDGFGRLLEIGVDRTSERDVIVHAMLARNRYL